MIKNENLYGIVVFIYIHVKTPDRKKIVYSQLMKTNETDEEIIALVSIKNNNYLDS